MHGKRPQSHPALRTTVLLADDHAVIRGAIRSDLEELGYEICAEVGDADAAVAAALEQQPGICLLDVTMPGGGIAAAREISERLPDTSVVMLTVSRDLGDVEASLEAGARGFVLKDLPSERLHAALLAVLGGALVTPAFPLS